MMDPVALFGLVSAVLVNSTIPGPCIVVLATRAGQAGLLAGLRVTAGVVAAQMLYLGLALGLIALAMALPSGAADLIKFGGALLMIYLAWTLVTPKPGEVASSEDAPRVASALPDFVAGLFVGLSSPFNLLFFFAILPQLVPEGGLGLLDALVIAGVTFVATPLPMVVWCFAAAQLGRRVTGTGRWLGRVGALSLVAFAGLVILPPG